MICQHIHLFAVCIYGRRGYKIKYKAECHTRQFHFNIFIQFDTNYDIRNFANTMLSLKCAFFTTILLKLLHISESYMITIDARAQDCFYERGPKMSK